MGPLRPAPSPIPLGDIASLLHIAVDSDVAAVRVTGISLDSRSVVPGDLFAALPGMHTHGASFLAQAREAGAVAVLTDEEGAAVDIDLPVLVVPHPRPRIGPIASLIYGEPSTRLTVLAVTGTNGKTTTTWMTEAALRAGGLRTGIIGTLGAFVDGVQFPLARTTPEATDLHALLAVMVERGVQCVVMEASSIAITEGRMDGVNVDVALFTHLTQDHLDYHGSMEAYFDAKAGLFDRAKRGIIGIDDEWGRELARICTLPYRTWALHDGSADWRASTDGAVATIRGPNGTGCRLAVPLPGEFNVANALCAVALAEVVGVAPEMAARGIEHVSVPGRMQSVAQSGRVRGIVDYAHTPDAVERALQAVRSRAAGRVICVMGAGGDRDRAKRPLMGAAASRWADVVIVTDDNPRTEDPRLIRREIIAGASSGGDVLEVAGRLDAIATAVSVARAGDVVIVLGKGHEQGQEIDGVVLPFDDAGVLADLLAVLPTDPTEAS